MIASPPAQLTSFVGRERELREVRSLLERRRLVTLAGVGGVGKTRLALELTTQLVSTASFSDGVVFVDLAPLGDANQVATALVDALGLVAQVSRTPDAVLLEYLESRELLLVLDNCEHVLQAVAPRVGDMLRAAPGVRILATSRQPLGIAGETVWRVPTLEIPALNVTTPDGVAVSDAVRLFVDRAQLAWPDFTLTEQNASAVARACHRLDGLPLAIELAAAMVPMLSVHELVERLDDRFRLLTRGSSTALPRQRTLRAMVAWSHDRLDRPEQTLLHRLAVFAGGWTLAAAEAVGALGGAPDSPPDVDVLMSLPRLIDMSLVMADEQRDGMRYRLLETIRDFALRQLRESGEDASVRQRHAAWCLDLATRFAAEWRGPEQLEWLERVEAEYPNMRAALAWCIERAQVRIGLPLATALWRFWELRGHVAEGREWLGRLLSLDGGNGQRAADRAWALNAAGYLALIARDVESGVRLLEESLAHWQVLGDRRGLAYALFSRGLAWQVGDLEVGEQRLRESLALGETLGDRVLQYIALYNLADLAIAHGDLNEAERLHEASLALKRAQGDAWSISNSLGSLAELARKRGDLDAAVQLYAQAVQAHRLVGDRRGLVYDLDGLAWIAAAKSDAARAARLLGAAEAQGEALGVRPRWPTVEAAWRMFVETAKHAALDSANFAADWSRGGSMSLDEALAHALAEGADSPRRETRTTTGSLSPREVEVARLVAGGLSNRQIAEKLVVTHWTAEKHVQHILDKLALSSRAQVAVWAVERGLLVDQSN